MVTKIIGKVNIFILILSVST